MTQKSRQRMRNIAGLFGTCILISALIFLVAVISEAFTQNVLTIKDPIAQILLAMFSILLFGVVIFFIVLVSPRFRRILFTAFGVDEDRGEQK